MVHWVGRGEGSGVTRVKDSKEGCWEREGWMGEGMRVGDVRMRGSGSR